MGDYTMYCCPVLLYVACDWKTTTTVRRINKHVSHVVFTRAFSSLDLASITVVIFLRSLPHPHPWLLPLFWLSLLLLLLLLLLSVMIALVLRNNTVRACKRGTIKDAIIICTRGKTNIQQSTGRGNPADLHIFRFDLYTSGIHFGPKPRTVFERYNSRRI